MYILGSLIIIGFFILLAILIFQPIKESNRDVLNLVVGALIGAFLTVVNYVFGSSKGSAEKTNIINKNNNHEINKKDININRRADT